MNDFLADQFAMSFLFYVGASVVMSLILPLSSTRSLRLSCLPSFLTSGFFSPGDEAAIGALTESSSSELKTGSSIFLKLLFLNWRYTSTSVTSMGSGFLLSSSIYLSRSAISIAAGSKDLSPSTAPPAAFAYPSSASIYLRNFSKDWLSFCKRICSSFFSWSLLTRFSRARLLLSSNRSVAASSRCYASFFNSLPIFLALSFKIVFWYSF